MSKNSDVIDIFPIYGQFGAIRKPEIFMCINSNFLSYENWKQN